MSSPLSVALPSGYASDALPGCVTGEPRVMVPGDVSYIPQPKPTKVGLLQRLKQIFAGLGAVPVAVPVAELDSYEPMPRVTTAEARAEACAKACAEICRHYAIVFATTAATSQIFTGLDASIDAFQQ